MEDKANNEKEMKKNGLFKKFFEKLDKKMQEKAKSDACCCEPDDKVNNSCCS